MRQHAHLSSLRTELALVHPRRDPDAGLTRESRCRRPIYRPGRGTSHGDAPNRTTGASPEDSPARVWAGPRMGSQATSTWTLEPGGMKSRPATAPAHAFRRMQGWPKTRRIACLPTQTRIGRSCVEALLGNRGLCAATPLLRHSRHPWSRRCRTYLCGQQRLISLELGSPSCWSRARRQSLMSMTGVMSGSCCP